MAFSFLSRLSLATLFHYKSVIKGEPVKAMRVANPYHAVAVLPGQKSCAAAKACAKTRFLSVEAPSVPLRDCDAGECTCRYQHFADRRSASRRTADGRVVRTHGTWRGVDRRRSGRRFDDE